MYPHVLILLFFSRLLLAQPTVLAKNITANIANVTSTSFVGTKPGCQRKCGNLSIPYPFGIGAACSFNPPFVINCSNSEPFLGSGVVLSISPTQVRVRSFVASMCYDKTGAVTNDSSRAWTSLPIDGPYTFSDTANKLTVVGCDDSGELLAQSQDAEILVSGCGSICSNSTDMTGANCPGIGCCQTDIPKGLKAYSVQLHSFYNHTQDLSKDKCGYAFVGEQDSFHYSNLSDFSDPNFGNRVPMVLDYAIGNQNCVEAQTSPAYLCQPNTSCSNNTDGGSGGYRCSCKNGYKGNPYLSPGCIDIDECEDPNLNDCDGNATCKNIRGNFSCSCNHRYVGNGRECTPRASQSLVIKLSLDFVDDQGELYTLEAFGAEELARMEEQAELQLGTLVSSLV